MSDSSPSYSFPHRTPVFTAVIVLLAFGAFAFLANKIYVPHATTVDKIEGVRSPEERKTLLNEHLTKEHAAATSYGWIDQNAGVVRLPIDRAIELTARDQAKK
jgi:hypothetical protein